jgi:rsbT co-antagonist protein RsbR
MAATLQQGTQDLEAQYSAAQSAYTQAEAARAEIAAQLATIEAQRDVIRTMSVPILPLTDRALVMPLIGELDADRLRLVQDQALQRIEQTAARYLICDITGVAIIDTQVAHELVRVVQAARLLGAEVVLVGVRPEVAQAIASLPIQLDGIVTLSTLQVGIDYVLRERSS